MIMAHFDLLSCNYIIVQQIRWLSIIRRVFKYAKVPITDNDEVVVQDSTYYRNLGSILQSTPPRVLANYFGWRYVLGYSDYTTKHFLDTYFNFQRVAYGQRKPEKAWETCYTVVDSYFPHTLGRLYIDSYFNPDSKPVVENLVKEVRNAFSQELDQYDWMDDFTRRRAKDKLHKMLASVAYQSFIRNNTQLESIYRGVSP
jgi:predicted metalloendopeptidase